MGWKGIQQRLVYRARLYALIKECSKDASVELGYGKERHILPVTVLSKATLTTTPTTYERTGASEWVPMRVELIETYWLEANDSRTDVGKQHNVGVYLLLFDPPSSLLPSSALDIGQCSWQSELGTDILWIECCRTRYCRRSPTTGSKPPRTRFATVGLREAFPSAVLNSATERSITRTTEGLRLRERKGRHTLLNALLDELLRSKATLAGISDRFVRAVYELVSTEAVYAADLQTILRAFLHPIRDAYKVGLLPAERERLLISSFSNVEVLAKVHQDLVQELHDCFREWQVPSLSSVAATPARDAGDALPLDRAARILLSKAFLFHLYSQYCSDFVERSENLERVLQQDSTIRDFLQRCESSELCHGESLGSFLIKPVQRLTRYGLLIHKIRRESVGRPCEQELHEAERRLGEIAELANKRQELAEDSRRLAALCLECGGDQRVIAPGRRIMRIQDVQYLEKRLSDDTSGENAQAGRLVLFQDALMLLRSKTSRRRKAGFVIQWIVPIGTLTVRELHDHAGFSANDCTFLTGSETADWLDAFEEVAAKRNPTRKSWEENLSPPTHDAVEFWGAHAELRHQRRKAFH
ncbi:hypothetical protein CCYA_CCYA20G4806 [Cyanidiococcus yangmingshanensis]|nr:hypothetical protein CCYA_CCYA20G4806 [Cyanidiococcus yangmingshanensis]